MSQLLHTVERRQGGANLLVMLPGAYMTAADYAAAGFFSAVERRRLDLDLLAVDLDLACISSGAALPAVNRQLLAPARQDYARVWLGGISLGGLLALCQAADQPESIDGLCLLAPYPGSRLTTNEIKAAGGLASWQPSPEQLEDPEFRAWRWLQRPPAGFPVFVGHGQQDRFAAGMQQIAACFPEAARHAVPGGHDWPVWQVLWEHFLDLGHFAA